MKPFKVLLILFLGTSVLHSTKLGVLKNVYNPRSIAVYKNSLYVTDQESVLVFSLEGLRQINKFVRKGQGPGEFNYTPLVKVSQEKIIVYKSMKFAIFSLSGELLFERYVPYFIDNITFFGENYFLSRMVYIQENGKLKTISSITLFNKNNNIIRDIVSADTSLKQSGTKMIIPLVQPLFKFVDFKDKIYMVNNANDFQFEVYNKEGFKEDLIKHEYQRIEVTEKDKERLLTDYLDLPQIKRKWSDKIKSRYKYSYMEFFPAIKDFYIAEDKIFVKTYREKNDNEEYWILSISGKLLKKVFLPKIKDGFYSFANGFFYYLFENDSDEEWECHYVKY